MDYVIVGLCVTLILLAVIINVRTAIRRLTKKQAHCAHCPFANNCAEMGENNCKKQENPL